MCEAMEKLMEEYRAEAFKKGFSEGLDKGREEAKQNTILNLLAIKAKLPIIVQATGWTEDRILGFLNSRGIQPAQ